MIFYDGSFFVSSTFFFHASAATTHHSPLPSRVAARRKGSARVRMPPSSRMRTPLHVTAGRRGADNARNSSVHASSSRGVMLTTTDICFRWHTFSTQCNTNVVTSSAESRTGVRRGASGELVAVPHEHGVQRQGSEVHARLAVARHEVQEGLEVLARRP